MACPVCQRDYLTIPLGDECCPGPAPAVRQKGKGRTPDHAKTLAVLALRAQNLTAREIGERLNMDPQAVCSRVQRARERGLEVAPRRRGPAPGFRAGISRAPRVGLSVERPEAA
jgi:hypothetical protein